MDTVVLDKTGTLTSGRMTVTGAGRRAEDRTRTTCCGTPGAVEHASDHPVAAAITAAAQGAADGGRAICLWPPAVDGSGRCRAWARAVSWTAAR